LKYSENINFIPYILEKYEKKELLEIHKTIKYIHDYIQNNYNPELIIDDDLFLNKEIRDLKVLLPRQLKLENIESIQV
jgi:hypothetical protein